MRSFSLRSLFVSMALTVAPCAWPAGIEGVWLVEDGRAHIRIARCGDAYCGTVIWMSEPLDENGRPRTDVFNRDPALRDRPILGMRLLEGVELAPTKKGVWKGGRIYDADSGKTYKCTLKPDGEDGLLLRGYVGMRLFGRSTYWTRVHE